MPTLTVNHPLLSFADLWCCIRLYLTGVTVVNLSYPRFSPSHPRIVLDTPYSLPIPRQTISTFLSLVCYSESPFAMGTSGRTTTGKKGSLVASIRQPALARRHHTRVVHRCRWQTTARLQTLSPFATGISGPTKTRKMGSLAASIHQPAPARRYHTQVVHRRRSRTTLRLLTVQYTSNVVSFSPRARGA
jgi:hypothetical protein